MKSYTIKNTAIMHKGKIFPEGSPIELDDKDAQSLSDYLVQTNLELEPELKTNANTKNQKRSK